MSESETEPENLLFLNILDEDDSTSSDEQYGILPYQFEPCAPLTACKNEPIVKTITSRVGSKTW